MFQRQLLAWAVHGGVEDWRCLIKKSDASVSKVSEQYAGAPQYLVDLVRHRLVFDSVDAQYRCLNTICLDPNVVVVRCAISSDITGIFDKPGVTVYFILTTPEAYDMGVSGHVLELQLVLRQISNIFDRAHDSYTAYRRALLSEQSITVRSLRHVFAGAAASCCSSRSVNSPLHRLQPLPQADWHADEMQPVHGDVATAIYLQALPAVDIEIMNVDPMVQEIGDMQHTLEELVGNASVEEEVCRMAPDMRDVLRQKCLENGDVKANSLFQVRVTLRVCLFCVFVFLVRVCLVYVLRVQITSRVCVYACVCMCVCVNAR